MKILKDWEKGKAYFINLRTGCSCCSDENELTGPYFSIDKALEDMDYFFKGKYKCSQYAPNGNYSLYEYEGYIQICEDEDGEEIKKFMYGDIDDDTNIIFNRISFFSEDSKLQTYDGNFIIAS